MQQTIRKNKIIHHIILKKPIKLGKFKKILKIWQERKERKKKKTIQISKFLQQNRFK